MKITVFHIEKAIGLFFQEWGNRLKNDIKTDRILSFISVSPFSIWGIITMVNLGIQIVLAIIIGIISIVILVSLFFGLFLALFKFIGSILCSVGDFFTRQSKTARFSYKIIPQVEKYQKAEYIIEVSNDEWFADAKDVKCSIGLGATVQDFEDRIIFDKFENNQAPRAIPYFLSGRWISEKETSVDIFRNKSKTMRFIKADILNNEIIVIGNSPDNYRPRDTSLPPRKYIFPIYVNGEIKNGDFHAQFNIEITYKGKDEISYAIMGNNFITVDVVEKKSGEAPLWSISNS